MEEPLEIPIMNDLTMVLGSISQVLGWQQVAAKIGMQRCAATSQWLNERISLSRYAHVPLGNFELDWLIHTSDVI
ncbi:DNA polymerase epsilon catalytic subunit A-like [Cannabis sativa]|uniref:DNA polymerase epsilon catalytic subunit A-like n=1 Tax=Cannabis sativa TaxID=3483 RepID=UPI0029CA41AB|nr:DNA polymerase epsilon catalytic subunit A-like [Cannabis sativa]